MSNIKAKLTIELTEDNQLNIMGPLEDKILCLGMLEMGKKMVWDFKGPEKKVVVANFVPPSTVPIRG